VINSFDLDWALRTVSLGWYQPDDTIPVTIVDIDEATHRSWQSPAITPRGELARLLSVVTAAAPSAVVVDIDLSGKEADADRAASSNFATLWAIVELRPHLPEAHRAGARRYAETVEEPFDPVFERNAKLHWAHMASPLKRRRRPSAGEAAGGLRNRGVVAAGGSGTVANTRAGMQRASLPGRTCRRPRLRRTRRHSRSTPADRAQANRPAQP
jgi:hypothetical protein